jgi:rhodanese-related sulfurtransferase
VDPLLSPEDLHAQLAGRNPPTVIDVRGEDAYRAGHIAGAVHLPGDELERRLAEIPRDKPVVTY